MRPPECHMDICRHEFGYIAVCMLHTHAISRILAYMHASDMQTYRCTVPYQSLSIIQTYMRKSYLPTDRPTNHRLPTHRMCAHVQVAYTHMRKKWLVACIYIYIYAWHEHTSSLNAHEFSGLPEYNYGKQYLPGPNTSLRQEFGNQGQQLLLLCAQWDLGGQGSLSMLLESWPLLLRMALMTPLTIPNMGHGTEIGTVISDNWHLELWLLRFWFH